MAWHGGSNGCGVKTGHDVKFFLQGADYFHALSELIDEAQDTIWILDWWLTPESV